MDTMITNFTKEERKKNIYTNKKGDTIMLDEDGRVWTLAGKFETLEDVEEAKKLLKNEYSRGTKINQTGVDIKNIQE